MMMKLMIALGAGLLIGGCAETPMNPAAEKAPYYNDGSPGPNTPEHGTLNPSKNELNHSGTADQNGGSSSTPGSTGSPGGIVQP